MEFVTITQTWYTYLMIGFWTCVPSVIIIMILQLFIFSPYTNRIDSENTKLEKENEYLRKLLTKYSKGSIVDIKQ